MNFEDFSVVEFPPVNPENPRFVYVLCWVGESEDVPFYVGQTTRLWGRLDDYYWAIFNACTDFRVGEAVRYLSTKGMRVVVKYRSSTDSRADESKIIDVLQKEGRRLLNDLSAFDYRSADQSQQRLRGHRFLDETFLALALPHSENN
jgi:hypothetical protein